jgi:hypothetical protein
MISVGCADERFRTRAFGDRPRTPGVAPIGASDEGARGQWA